MRGDERRGKEMYGRGLVWLKNTCLVLGVLWNGVVCCGCTVCMDSWPG